MTITVKVIADSISPSGQRLSTMQLRYPRFIHAEFMTHRMFSRNASSSRAIPVERIIRDIQEDPAVPVHWGANQSGMQAREELDSEAKLLASCHWFDAMDDTIKQVQELVKLGLHKQVANRLLEPWSHINVVVTATDWANFFALRCHPDAQPEIQQLAQTMQHALLLSTPRLLVPGEWHLPYVEVDDYQEAVRYLQQGRVTRDMPSQEEVAHVLRKVSTARCARVSYLTHDGRKTTLVEDIELHNKLVEAEPLHASPAEHQATPDEKFTNVWANAQLHGNFVGWCQHRKMLPNEFVAG
ncbi:FAD-dependent thymidylate synthase [Caballeronia sp. LZ034LL]|uniref:FAD-dependent thymidylate synthase n=1 Tax=Caballeronia sp. LZ034LL TaxID=3038567 RepID=UPI002855CDB1|nr:FAD-dependent thymidylate synthase [Caballeronia sp. LZ034LL]MDR5839295.1 FAD-dependent thymidylate synthase [Caballeronia sp. LZ034LL]